MEREWEGKGRSENMKRESVCEWVVGLKAYNYTYNTIKWQRMK